MDEGLAALKKATELRQDYDDAIAYLSLMDRQKADLTTDPAEKDALLKEADTLMDQVKQIKQKKAAAQPNSSFLRSKFDAGPRNFAGLFSLARILSKYRA